jgi:predicted RNA-binding protein with TRAM domain
VGFNWVDDEGFEYEVNITSGALEEAKIEGHEIIVKDETGDEVVIECYKLIPNEG